MYALLHYLSEVRVDAVLLDVLYHAAGKTFLKGNYLSAAEHGHVVYLADNGVCNVEGDLAAVSAVNLVAVVLSGVVRSRYHDTCGCAEVAYSVGEHGGRHKLFVNIYLYTVRNENSCSLFSENVRFYSGVVGDSYRAFFKVAVYVVGKTLSSAADGVDVHAVAACADNAAKSARTEFEISVKAVEYSVVVALDVFQLGLKISVVGSLFAP